jgi:uncharacterized DUF497 family protein
VKFVWDERKRERNLAEHGLDFAAVEAYFDFDDALISSTRPGRDGRPRSKAIGAIQGRAVALVVSALGSEAISLISLRPASLKERRLYEEA